MTTLRLVGIYSLFLLSACGGGDSSEPASPPPPPRETVYSDYNITAIDGYLENATVWLDVQDSGNYLNSNPTATTGDKGKATLSIPDTIIAKDHAVLVEAKKALTFDEGLGKIITNSFTLAAPAGERIITPFSTLVYLKMKSGTTKNTAASELSAQLQIPAGQLLTDFIELKHNRMTLIAADLVRLDVFPESPQQLANVARDPRTFNTDINKYAEIQSDVNAFRGVARNSLNVLELDTDIDGIADSDDSDIDGDGIPNTQDNHPYNFDRHTAQSPSELTLSRVQDESLLEEQWHYYKLETPEDILLNVNISQLSGDIDLYVKQGAIPTKFDYDCRSNNSYHTGETCLQRLKTGTTHFIAVYAQQDASYRLKAKLDEIVINKTSLLLHGLASEADTWSNLVADDSFYSGACTTINIGSEIETLPQVNSKGESCFRLDFGGFDRDTNLSSKGLEGKTCISALSCNGDYSNFNLLGEEVEIAIEQIINKLGIDTEIVLLGHSRGGLAARAYLQNTSSQYIDHVKALITTGTPHQGSPLGRFYRYMELNCLPQQSHENDNGICEDSWEVIKLMAGERWYSSTYHMDLRVPSIDFLSPESTEITNLNTNVVMLENIITSQLNYRGTKFGVLAKDATLWGNYDLYDYGQLAGGDHPHPSTLRYIEQGVSRESLIGDGIVPSYSQQLSNLLIPYGRNVDLSSTNSEENVIHTEQPSQVTDLHTMFESVRNAIGWSE
ncbi:alpha/beta fold hydrolase [Shewanella pneumatophori]|uniref:Peptidase n=1 Tax=Shewanella pneumatophori TaxID=314092 RepID=A0A9X1Z8U3_9GAMM|nr:alpha/beta fold hydrolase [Shewanella pneumatophori]MCL1137694.1 peptidase [Shewanella pneumatophori]